VTNITAEAIRWRQGNRINNAPLGRLTKGTDMSALLTRTIRQAGLVAAIVISCVSYANAGELPGGYSCNDLRAKVSAYGATTVISMAKSHGYSDRTILRVRNKCRV
jgi:hypothetical protein